MATPIRASTAGPALAPERITTTHASVTERLRRAITGGELEAGARLVQSDLAERLGVSVTPVREALRDLITEGLVDFDAFKSAVVHTPTRDEVDYIYEIRRQLLPLSIKRGSKRVTPDQIADARALSLVMRDTTDRVAWTALNRQFHAILDEAAQAPRLRDILDRMTSLSMMHVNLITPPLPFAHNDEHDAILDAYEAGNAAVACRIALEHLSNSHRTARAAYSAAPLTS